MSELSKAYADGWRHAHGVLAPGRPRILGIVNDVSGVRLDADMRAVCAAAGAGVVLMHSRGDVGSMGTYTHAAYGPDVTGDVTDELDGRAAVARRSGIFDEQIVIDPGIGFAKRTAHSLAVLRELGRVVDRGFPLLVGLSRKRFIGELSGVALPADRVAGPVAASVAALERGARLFRVHDVRPHREALDVACGIVHG